MSNKKNNNIYLTPYNYTATLKIVFLGKEVALYC
jgi:hypothetical protein